MGTVGAPAASAQAGGGGAAMATSGGKGGSAGVAAVAAGAGGSSPAGSACAMLATCCAKLTRDLERNLCENEVEDGEEDDCQRRSERFCDEPMR